MPGRGGDILFTLLTDEEVAILTRSRHGSLYFPPLLHRSPYHSYYVHYRDGRKDGYGQMREQVLCSQWRVPFPPLTFSIPCVPTSEVWTARILFAPSPSAQTSVSPGTPA